MNLLQSAFFLLSLLLFSCNVSHSQTETPNHQTESWDPYENPGDCAVGTAEAKADFKTGKLSLIRFGLEPAKQEIYWEELQKAGVSIKFELGCEIDDATDCYNSWMYSKIAEEKGEDFFEQIRARTDSLYGLKYPD